MVGTEIGSYRILEKLGEGGTGAVYRALDGNLDRTVAMKLLNVDFSADPGLEQRFRAEIKPLGDLYHTNLVTLHALLVDQGRPWLVTEFVDGESFEQMLRRRGAIPAEEAIALFRQALFGIGYAHRMGLVHRDIKSANVMVNRQGVVKVTDFGLAKALSARGVGKAGVRMGTPAYMSPEQFLNRGADARSDIYSLGVTLYEMLTAKLPFSADNDYQIMSDHVNTPPPPPMHFVPDIPLPAERAVLKALEKSPAARFQSVGEFSASLGDLQSSPAGPPVMATVAPSAAGVHGFFVTRDQKLIAAAIAAILLLGGVLLAMRMSSKRAAAQPATAAAVPVQNEVPPPPADSGAPADAVAVAPAQPDAAAGAGPAPAFAIPAGTVVAVRMNDAVSSSVNQAGQSFDATVDADVVVNGVVAVASGSDAGVVLVKVAQVPVDPRSDVQLQLTRLNINGADYRARSSIFEQQSQPRNKKGAATAGTRAAFGAIGGFLTHGSAGQSAAAGAASAFVVNIPAETRIQFTLRKAITLAQ